MPETKPYRYTVSLIHYGVHHIEDVFFTKYGVWCRFIEGDRYFGGDRLFFSWKRVEYICDHDEMPEKHEDEGDDEAAASQEEGDELDARV